MFRYVWCFKSRVVTVFMQSGFRKSHSTETALIRLTDQLLVNLDNNHSRGLVFIDYKKAFDLIDQKILLSKLETYVIQSCELFLISNYSMTRKQYVCKWCSVRISCYHLWRSTWVSVRAAIVHHFHQ